MTPSKVPWLHCLLLCISIREMVSSSIFYGDSEPVCSDGHQCLPIQDCALYQTKSAILRSRPTLCGVSGKTTLVCCPANTNTPEPSLHENLVTVLPTECGISDPALPDPTPQPCPEDGFCPLGEYDDFNAQVGKWPWMVLLGKWSEDPEIPDVPPIPGQLQLGRWFCGGVLITDRHVLTAAHCLRPEQVGSVGARLGEYDLSETLDVVHQDRNITRITRHEDFWGAQNNIAVLLLERPIDPSPTIRPICLPPAGSEHAGRNVFMAGWGYFKGRPSFNHLRLRQVPLRVSDVFSCERAFSGQLDFELDFPGGFQGTKVCAVSWTCHRENLCEGDSGGPLMAQTPGGLYELVGVVGVGEGCYSYELPGIYTKVSAYISWILRNLT